MIFLVLLLIKSLISFQFALEPTTKLSVNSSVALTLLAVSLSCQAFTTSSLYCFSRAFPLSLSLSLSAVPKRKQMLCRLFGAIRDVSCSKPTTPSTVVSFVGSSRPICGPSSRRRLSRYSCADAYESNTGPCPF